jgi:hypothetical protein
MGAAPKGDSPFELLLEEMTRTNYGSSATDHGSGKSDFNFASLLKNNNKRKDTRINATGQVELYNEDGSLLSNAVLRNISHSGMAVELYPVEVAAQSTVYVNLAGKGGNFGKLKAQVQWINSVPEHPHQHKQMGIAITESDEDLKAKYAQFVKLITTVKR